MRVITLNVNGIRSAERKGLAHWLVRGQPWDIVCLQEIRAAAEHVPRAIVDPRRAHAIFHPAQRKGYSGVAMYARRPVKSRTGFGNAEFDAEGRYLEADFGDLAVISV
ncbi:MAG: endonuclease/exonuclease/phosphatase family protein, partial [Betaproteobacteria bacterium]